MPALEDMMRKLTRPPNLIFGNLEPCSEAQVEAVYAEAKMFNVPLPPKEALKLFFIWAEGISGAWRRTDKVAIIRR
mgnify:CR=1 FL=1